MLIQSEEIQKAKDKLGDRNAEIMVEELGITDFDERNLKCCCPYHEEDTPSFVFNRKNHTFHCFGCGKSVDILDVFMETGSTYIEACRKLFDLADIPHAFGEANTKTRRQYKYPIQESNNHTEHVHKYLELRGISPKTADYADVREDHKGNCVFNYYDTNDVLTTVKYRPAHAVEKGHPKTWCQQGADTTPLLFNMNRINTNQPLLITEGEIDCLAAIESGYQNSVSVPFGANNYAWIEENWSWLEQFDSIIIASDNDEAGNKMRKECVYRLGSWRCKIVDIPECYIKEDGSQVFVSDINEMMYWFGKQAVFEAIIHAKDTPVDSVVDFSDIGEVDLAEIDGIYTGIKEFDQEMMRLFYGTFNIVTGVNGCVDCETEFFTGTGWKKISEYVPGDKVLQYNSDGTADLVEPLKYHKYPCDHFWHFKSQYGIDQCVSDEHNLVYLTSKGNLQKKNTLDWLDLHERNLNGFAGKMITTFKYDGSGIPLTDEEVRVMCAVIADGSFPYKNNTCRINIKKQQKKDRLRILLDDAGIEYEIHKYSGDIEYETFLFKAPLHTKEFDEYWYQCSRHQLEIIADEVIYWDGTQSCGRKSFNTTIRKSADFVQFAFSVAGYRSHIGVADRRNGERHRPIEYTVSKTTQIHPSLVNVKEKIVIPKVPSKDGYKYCFTVPSGMLVLRRENQINITGNSGKSSFLLQLIAQSLDQGKDAWLYSKELPNYMTKNWANFIFAGNRHIRQYVTDRKAVHYRVDNDAKKAIDNYYKKRFFVYKDGWDNRIEDIEKSMVDSARKYGAKLFIIDNLTAINMDCGDNEKWGKQVDFVNWLIDFAQKYHVIVILVIHPRKIETMRRLSKFDVAGLGSIVDLAHRLISLYRVTPKDKKGIKNMRGGWHTEPIKYDVMLDVLKDRMRGRENLEIGLYYDVPSRRFFTDYDEYSYQYAWDKTKYSDKLPAPKQLQISASPEIFGKLGAPS